MARKNAVRKRREERAQREHERLEQIRKEEAAWEAVRWIWELENEY